MRVRDVMTTEVESCSPTTDLATAAMIMWRKDCGVVPVLTPGTEQVQGVITDRDICMGLATSGRRPSERTVGEVMARTPFTVRSSDQVASALEVMKREHVRRLPVVDEHGALQGILSVNDLVLAIAKRKGRGEALQLMAGLMETLHGICEHRRPATDEALVASGARHVR